MSRWTVRRGLFHDEYGGRHWVKYGPHWDEYGEGRSDARSRLIEGLARAAVDGLGLTEALGYRLKIAAWDQLIPICDQYMSGTLSPGDAVARATSVFANIKKAIDTGLVDESEIFNPGRHK